MARLVKRNRSGNWYFRKRIPADVQPILAKLPKERWPCCWYKTGIILISTGTADKNLARTSQLDIASDVERQFKALREGPKPLTP
ncbi:hypothetical protein FXB40_25305 [Bradyrhizobium rifense]|uniref:DUF6538 domain-containing protein n=1 Tax=Bradyrhizobium rifense TaxID=515499 RepID=A0A5D3KCH5_9BRAD|nr:DUF6538 domain-containing protein [Bradyrhizobium rifense]TYL92404.1 hypothetical protein FXB40_25305 [Bradyrhizobium rifense]